jgi:hypothetical protein
MVERHVPYEPPALTRKALLALEEHCGSRDGQFPRTLALKFVLAYLYRASKPPRRRDPFDALWRDYSYVFEDSQTATDQCRRQHVSTCLNGIFRGLGVDRGPDYQFVKLRQEQLRQAKVVKADQR